MAGVPYPLHQIYIRFASQAGSGPDKNRQSGQYL